MSAPASTMHKAQVGVIGLGVMGQNLALNLAEHGQSVVLWNHSPERVTHFLEEHGSNRRFLGAGTVAELTRSLTSPRRILLMIKAGDPVDEMLRDLTPCLAPGDIVMDGGNSFFRDTQRREAALRQRNIHFLGMGVSGGEGGARYGPSLMPGGPREAYEQVRSLLESIAAKTDSGPCVTYVGPDGAGHFVKMVRFGRARFHTTNLLPGRRKQNGTRHWISYILMCPSPPPMNSHSRRITRTTPPIPMPPLAP